MPVDVLLGLQWGDEGKGKVVDLIAPRYEIVGRFQGGPNAGHTLVHNGVKHVLHQVPSGIFHPPILNVIGNGVVLDPVVFEKEIAALRARNLEPERNLVISAKAQVIVPTHRLLDRAMENRKGEHKIGSTLRGIGPAYQDKYARHGLRVGDLLRSDFAVRYEALRRQHMEMLAQMGGTMEIALDEMEEAFFKALATLRRFRIEETEYLLNDALKDGTAILAEGAQGALLDIDFGSYPYVTSSSTMTAGACMGLGIAPRHIRNVIGIFKAYCTRVGAGPFPTELHDEVGEQIRRNGNEFGSTTGRPRRTGWLDLPALRYAAMLSGATELMMMKADVLDGLSELKVCTDYQLNNERIRRFPTGADSEYAKPIFEALAPWHKPERPATEASQLEDKLRDFIRFIEQATDLPITLLSTGPDRQETLLLGGN